MKKLFIAFLVVAAAPGVGFAQKKDKVAEKMGKTITAAELQKHLYIVAGAEMEGRNTPSAGLEKAANYLIDNFKSYGLQPGNAGTYRQYFPLYKDQVVSESFSLNGAALKAGEDYVASATNFTAQLNFSEAIFAGYGIVEEGGRDDYKGLNVAGRLVIIVDGAPEGYKPQQQGRMNPAAMMIKTRVAQSKGAAAILFVTEKLTPRRENNNFSRTSSAAALQPFTFTVTNKVAESILGSDVKSALAKKETATAPHIAKAAMSFGFTKQTVTEQVSNVVAVIEGSDKKDEYVIVTAHYDHDGIKNGKIYYGADDDGSGTVALLEIAQAFAEAKKAGKGPRRTVVIMPVSGEEKGLWGSAHYSENPIFPVEKTAANVNIDMIGRVGEEYLKDTKDSGNYVYVIGDDRLSSDLESLVNAANRYTNLKLDRKYNGDDPNRFYFRSDHFNFAIKGIPAIFYFNGTHPDYHQPTDTPDKINYKLLEKRAQLAFYTAWELANRDEMPKRDLELKIPGR